MACISNMFYGDYIHKYKNKCQLKFQIPHLTSIVYQMFCIYLLLIGYNQEHNEEYLLVDKIHFVLFKLIIILSNIPFWTQICESILSMFSFKNFCHIFVIIFIINIIVYQYLKQYCKILFLSIMNDILSFFKFQLIWHHNNKFTISRTSSSFRLYIRRKIFRRIISNDIIASLNINTFF
ncbi:hypothetical protein AGLY_012843 [Aphis glycines]|uniref:Transmembrane protein n=1 Tax=Aphis glycines TaxID=307491 RepID=A0A6G0T7Z5_APHGL|nr:hypothetical protein AGLY_012843 [Aphis glycines]